MSLLPKPRQSLATFLAVASFALSLPGCTSVGLNVAQNAAGDPSTCAIDVRIFDRAKDAKAGHLSGGRVVSDLERGGGETVHRAQGAEWTLSGLPPGEYRLRIRQWRNGNADEDRPDIRITKTLTLRSGERAAVEAVGRSVTTGSVLIGVAAMVAVVAIVTAITAQNTRMWDSEFVAAGLPSAGAAASPVPGGAPPPPVELEELARTVAQAFPE
jgi:hypothetical protein